MSEMDIATMEERTVAADQRTAEEIAGSINRIKAEVREAVLDGSIRIGRELQAAKSKVPYGEWADWLEENVDYSVRTAQNLMRIADEYGRRRTEAMEGLSITQAVLLLGLPAQERAEFVESHDMDSITTDELREQIKRLNEEKASLQMTIDGMLQAAEEEREDPAQGLREQLEETERKLAAANREAEAAEAEANALRAGHNKDMKQKAEELRKAQQDASEQSTKAMAAKKTIEGLTRQKERLEEELQAARNRPETVVYETPPEVEAELKKLRESAGRSEEETVLRTMYKAVVDDFTRLQEQLGIVRGKDPELWEKMAAAIAGGLEKMAEVIRG